MGLFDFVKSVGTKLGIGDDEEEATPPTAEDLKKELDSHNLGTDKVQIEVQGDTAIVKGDVSDQATFEKAILAVGNTMGISKVEATELKAGGSDGGEPVLHEVKKGENLWKIAEQHYGNGSKYTDIFEANKPMLSDPDKIYPGQMLRIPNVEQIA